LVPIMPQLVGWEPLTFWNEAFASLRFAALAMNFGPNSDWRGFVPKLKKRMPAFQFMRRPGADPIRYGRTRTSSRLRNGSKPSLSRSALWPATTCAGCTFSTREADPASWCPEEAAVVGVDNEEILCELCNPPLSSVAPNPERIGYAAELLDGLMAEKFQSQRRIAIDPVRVFARQSTDVMAVATGQLPVPRVTCENKHSMAARSVTCYEK
jgi:substrate-binding family protein